MVAAGGALAAEVGGAACVAGQAAWEWVTVAAYGLYTTWTQWAASRPVATGALTGALEGGAECVITGYCDPLGTAFSAAYRGGSYQRLERPDYAGGRRSAQQVKIKSVPLPPQGPPEVAEPLSVVAPPPKSDDPRTWITPSKLDPKSRAVYMIATAARVFARIFGAD